MPSAENMAQSPSQSGNTTAPASSGAPPLSKIDTDVTNVADAVAADAPRSSSSSQKSSAPLSRTRTMSSGGGLLRRLTSRTSVHQQDNAEYVPPPVSSPSKSSVKSVPKPDKAALSRSTSKYKSGARWDLLDFNGMADSPQDELMDTGSAARKREEAARIEAARAAEDQKKTAEMLAQGSTAAAKAYAQRQSMGDPFFAAHQRAAADAAAAHAQRMHQASHAQHQYPPIGQALAANEVPSGVNADGIRQGLAGPNQDRMLAEAAQRVLEAARRSTNASATNANGASSYPNSPVTSSTAASRPPSFPASAKGMSGNGTSDTARSSLSKTNGSPLRSAPASISSTRSKSFLGFTKKDKEEKESSKGKSSGKKMQRQGRQAVSDYAGASSTDVSNLDLGSSDTVRRRRYKDTRELDLLASELAASALLGNRYGTPYMNGSTDNFSPGSYPYGSGSQGNLASPSATFLQPGGASPQASRLSMTPSSVPNSPQHLAHDTNNQGRYIPPLDPSQSPVASQSTHSLSVPNSPYATQRVQLNGLPPDMLTGLGDGPYPSLARRIENAALAFGLDPVDPFGIPTNHMEGGPFEASMQYANRTNVYHSPVQSGFRGRTGSSGASSLTSASKRPMLSMSMYSPDTESEGLTKVPRNKGSRANSRNVTPKTSSSGLREKSRESTGAQSNGSGTHGTGVSGANSSSGTSLQGHNAADNGSGSSAPSPDLTNAPKKSSNLTVPSVNASDKGGREKEAGRLGRLSFFGGRRSRANSLSKSTSEDIASDDPTSPVGSMRASSVGAHSSVSEAADSALPNPTQDQLFLTASHDSTMAKRSSGLSARSRERAPSGSSIRSQGPSPAHSSSSGAPAEAKPSDIPLSTSPATSQDSQAVKAAAEAQAAAAKLQAVHAQQQGHQALLAAQAERAQRAQEQAQAIKKSLPAPPAARPSQGPVAEQVSAVQPKPERSLAPQPQQPQAAASNPAATGVQAVSMQSPASASEQTLATPRPAQRRAISPARTERASNQSTSAGAAQNRKVSAQSLVSATERPSSKASSSTNTSESAPNKNRFSRFVSRLTSSDRGPKPPKALKAAQQAPIKSTSPPAASASASLSEQQRQEAVTRSMNQRQAALQQAEIAQKQLNAQVASVAARQAAQQPPVKAAATHADDNEERMASTEVRRQIGPPGDRRPSATPSNLSAEDDFRAAQAFVNAGLGGSLRSSVSGHGMQAPPGGPALQQSAANTAGFGTRAAVHEIIQASDHPSARKTQVPSVQQQQPHNQSGGSIPSDYDLTPHTSDGSVSTRSTEISSAGIVSPKISDSTGGVTPTAPGSGDTQLRQHALHQELGLELDGQDARPNRFQLSSTVVLGQ